MPFYIVPFNYESNLSVLKLNQIGLSVLFYKSKEGPLGICSEDLSSMILFSIIKNSIWYSILDKKLLILNKRTFDSNKYNLKGFIFLSPQNNNKEISECKEALRIIEKNTLLKKYNKPQSLIPNSVIIQSYENEIYNKHETIFLLKGKNTLLWNWSEFGGHLIFDNFANNYFIEALKVNCAEMNETIIFSDDLSNVQSW